jgi:nitrogen regulatory protein PII
VKRIDTLVDAAWLDELRENLALLGLRNFRIRPVRPAGRLAGAHLIHLGSALNTQASGKLEFTMLVNDEQAPSVVSILSEHGGADEILVSAVEKVFRIYAPARYPLARAV